jgi:Icc-related predicted phosphoesterase
MKLVIISDTHNHHDKLDVESGDVIIHSGDCSGRGWEHEIKNFIKWYSELDFTHKIYVPGNHEIGLEEKYDEWKVWFAEAGIDILFDETITVEGISTDDWEWYEYKVHGSPITPNFGSWAFMRARGEEIQKHWFKIPSDTDILVTHGPPHGILDEVPSFWGPQGVEHAGCEMLLARVKQVKPKLHIFGHIHEGYGSLVQDGVEYINASIMDESYTPVNQPTVRFL